MVICVKTDKDSIINYAIIILSLIILVLSFSNFYTITTTGSVIDDLSGGFCQSTEESRNSLFSVFCALLVLVSVVVKSKWARILALVAAIANILTITVLYPFLVAAMSIIGATYSVKLTVIGWIATGLVLLTEVLLIIKNSYLGKISKIEEKGGNIE